MHNKGPLKKLNMEGKPMDIHMRKVPFDENNERRGRVVGDNTWYDKGILFWLPTDSKYQNAEKQVTKFFDSIKNYILDKSGRSILITAMYSGMNSHKLVKKLENDDADYWKMLKAVTPTIKELTSLDEILSDEAIRYVMRKLLEDELEHPSEDMADDLKFDYYHEGNFPLDVETMFA